MVQLFVLILVSQWQPLDRFLASESRSLEESFHDRPYNIQREVESQNALGKYGHDQFSTRSVGTTIEGRTLNLSRKRSFVSFSDKKVASIKGNAAKEVYPSTLIESISTGTTFLPVKNECKHYGVQHDELKASVSCEKVSSFKCMFTKNQIGTGFTNVQESSFLTSMSFLSFLRLPRKIEAMPCRSSCVYHQVEQDDDWLLFGSTEKSELPHYRGTVPSCLCCFYYSDTAKNDDQFIDGRRELNSGADETTFLDKEGDFYCEIHIEGEGLSCYPASASNQCGDQGISLLFSLSSAFEKTLTDCLVRKKFSIFFKLFSNLKDCILLEPDCPMFRHGFGWKSTPDGFSDDECFIVLLLHFSEIFGFPHCNYSKICIISSIKWTMALGLDVPEYSPLSFAYNTERMKETRGMICSNGKFKTVEDYISKEMSPVPLSSSVRVWSKISKWRDLQLQQSQMLKNYSIGHYESLGSYIFDMALLFFIQGILVPSHRLSLKRFLYDCCGSVYYSNVEFRADGCEEGIRKVAPTLGNLTTLLRLLVEVNASQTNYLVVLERAIHILTSFHLLTHGAYVGTAALSEIIAIHESSSEKNICDHRETYADVPLVSETGPTINANIQYSDAHGSICDPSTEKNVKIALYQSGINGILMLTREEAASHETLTGETKILEIEKDVEPKNHHDMSYWNEVVGTSIESVSTVYAFIVDTYSPIIFSHAASSGQKIEGRIFPFENNSVTFLFLTHSLVNEAMNSRELSWIWVLFTFLLKQNEHRVAAAAMASISLFDSNGIVTSNSSLKLKQVTSVYANWTDSVAKDLMLCLQVFVFL